MGSPSNNNVNISYKNSNKLNFEMFNYLTLGITDTMITEKEINYLPNDNIYKSFELSIIEERDYSNLSPSESISIGILIHPKKN